MKTARRGLWQGLALMLSWDPTLGQAILGRRLVKSHPSSGSWGGPLQDPQAPCAAQLPRVFPALLQGLAKRSSGSQR